MTEAATRARRQPIVRRALGALLLLLLALAAAELLLRTRPLRVPTLLAHPAEGRLTPARAGFVAFDVAAVPARPRVLYVGASTEAGFPFGPANSLAAWVQRVLAARGLDVEVVPVAAAGLDAEQTLDLFPQLFELRPAAIVVGVGHNEFLRTERLLASGWLSQLELVRRGCALLAGPDEVADVPAPSAARDFDRGALLGRFRAALAGMQAEADEDKVPLLFTVPAGNLADFPPMLGGDARLGEDPDAAFDRGRAKLAAGDVAAARAAFERARDLDLWPDRAPREFAEAVRATGRAVRTDLAIDAAAAPGVPGDELFLDHCHPTPAGSAALAVAVADALEGLGLWTPSGRQGFVPKPAVLLAGAELTAQGMACARADVARAMAAYALMTRRAGRLAEMADRRLAAAAADCVDAGEVEWLRALLALQRGDVAGAQRHLSTLERASPRAAPELAREAQRFPWLRELLERNGLARTAP